MRFTFDVLEKDFLSIYFRIRNSSNCNDLQRCFPQTEQGNFVSLKVSLH